MKKVLSVALTLILVVGLQLGFTNYAEADSNLLDGEYTVDVQLMDKTNIDQPILMGGGALATPGVLEVENGEWSLILDLQPTMGTTVRDIKYYENGLGSNLIDAEVLSDDGAGHIKVKIPIEQNSNGRHVQMVVVMMGFPISAYVKCEVPNQHVITSSAGENGSISPEGEVGVLDGESQSFTITPDAGYQVADVLVDGASIGAKLTHLFEAVTGDHSIEAQFEKIPGHTISATAGDHGSISPEGDVEVADGGDQEFTITPDEGYRIADVLVDGTSIGAATNYTFENVTGDRSIEAQFEAIPTYTISATAGENGSISPEGDVVVAEGENQLFTFTPDEGYRVADVLMDGASVGAMNSYTIGDVMSDHTIEVQFEEIPSYTISAVADENGSISPEGDVVVAEGGNQTFTFTPDEGYRVADVLVDGASVGAMNSYMMENVMSDHTIAVTFEVDAVVYSYTIVSGGDQSMVVGSDSLEPIVIDGDFMKFLGVQVDDEELAPENYSAESGSTIVSFSEDYLKSLAVGQHNIKFMYENDAMVMTTLTVTAKEDLAPAGTVTAMSATKSSAKDANPATGDNAAPLLAVILLGAAMVTILFTRKRVNSHK